MNRMKLSVRPALVAGVVGLTAIALMATSPRQEVTDAAPQPAGPPESTESPAPPVTAKQPEPRPRSEWITAVEPKPLNGQVKKGLQWLVEQQHDDGGWDQGDTNLRQREAAEPDVGDTCAACLALLRSGSTPSDGPYAPAIRKALGFIMKYVEESDPTDLSVSGGLHTRLHAKLGPNIDTFLASLVLTEADQAMPDKPSADRLAAALDKVLYKIQINQGADGRWAGAGWAPALADAIAVKSLNRAHQKGYNVPAAVLARAEAHAVGEFRAGRVVAAGGGGAGVPLYGASKNMAFFGSAVSTNRKLAEDLQEQAISATTPEARQAAQMQLDRFAATETAFAQARGALVARLDDDRFVAGFGSNGGEEFLSFLNIGESLLLQGGADWVKWDNKISAALLKVQNADGSWTGHHCITGRTFCTSAALMVLTVDRTLMPPEAIEEARVPKTPTPTRAPAE